MVKVKQNLKNGGAKSSPKTSHRKPMKSKQKVESKTKKQKSLINSVEVLQITPKKNSSEMQNLKVQENQKQNTDLVRHKDVRLSNKDFVYFSPTKMKYKEQNGVKYTIYKGKNTKNQSGRVIMEPGSVKPATRTKLALNMLVHDGELILKIEDRKPLKFKSGQMIIVPPDKKYEMKNEHSKKCLIHFSVGPFNIVR